MRIIGGHLKGRKIFLPNDKHTRPLRDMVKESKRLIFAQN